MEGLALGIPRTTVCQLDLGLRQGLRFAGASIEGIQTATIIRTAVTSTANRAHYGLISPAYGEGIRSARPQLSGTQTAQNNTQVPARHLWAGTDLPKYQCR